jgi:dTDP-4-dehydrorhamnose 3,5-epimerase
MGRLTFASTIAAAVRHLIEARPAYGVYNVTNSGEPVSWFDVAQAVYAECGADVSLVSGTTTAEYAAGVLAAGRPFAPRPLNSRLDCEKLRANGFEAPDWRSELRGYLAQL